MSGIPLQFNDFTSLYIMARLNRNNIYNCITNNRADLSYTKMDKPNTPHITLFEIVLNNDHHLTEHIKNNLDRNTFQMPQIRLKLSNYSIKGRTENKFFTIECSVIDGNITDFRKSVYKKIDNIIGKKALKSSQDSDYVYYSVDNIILYAVPTHSHGNLIWMPHISIINTETTHDDVVKYYLSRNNVTNIQSMLNNVGCLKKELDLQKSSTLALSFSKPRNNNNNNDNSDD
ncbi:hypothetical protein Hokovirus_1_215 [Hokovirus HKV1]|uniref:Uncharacterized protein n=1 Tax=Hokovirus HKV1 TaxID=1977638 RepID=A0A1V0SF35_9VIRU|nr:hypothetical protein Hokovirus_1_215 [Hokovirus HKV1]